MAAKVKKGFRFYGIVKEAKDEQTAGITVVDVNRLQNGIFIVNLHALDD
jgi:hypothetical protein